MPDKQMKSLIEIHLHFYKNIAIDDVYKLLYQGLFGAEHLLQDKDSARRWFMKEWHAVSADSSEPIIVPVSVDGGIVRANLRPCKAIGFTAEQVWQAFEFSARKATFSGDKMKKAWKQFCQLCRDDLPFDAGEATSFGAEMEAAGFPARHHSQAYKQANNPAYRVLEASLLGNLSNENWRNYE